MNSKMFIPAENNQKIYQDIAIDIQKAVTNRFPQGGINILVNIAHFFEDPDKLSKVAKKLEAIRGRLPDYSSELLDVKAGFCDDLAQYAVQYAAKAFPNHTVELVGLKHHVLLVVGRDQSSNLDNVKTWGKDAILFDVWAKWITNAHKFETFRKEGKYPKIGFVKNFTIADSFDDYLEGEAFIDVHRTCQNYQMARKNVPKLLVNSYIQQIQEYYKNPNESLPDVHRCLRIAASRGDLRKTCFLIEYAEADPTLTSSNGRTAIAWAIENHHTECVEYLNQQAASYNQSFTPLPL